MNTEVANQILIFLILFFGIFVFAGLLKYIGLRNGIIEGAGCNNVSGTQKNIATVYQF
jgi:hypothetical protein